MHKEVWKFMKVAKSEILSLKKEILSYLAQHGTCRNETIAEMLHLSISTVRRYALQMEEAGLIIRYHGGMTLRNSDQSSVSDSVYLTRNSREKAAIMKYVADHLIKPEDTIFVNGSSTALFLYQYLDKPATILTNNAQVLQTERNDAVSTILIGGQPSSHNGSNIMCGNFAVQMIESIYATTCILGVSGINTEVGLTSSSPQDISINKAMLAHSRVKRIVVADHSKIGKIFNFGFSSLRNITHLVTDEAADPTEIETIKEHGVHVICVKVD